MKVLQVGMLIPWVNTAMEEEISTSVHPNIGLHWSRMRPKILPKDGHDTSYLEHMLLALPDALSGFDGLKLQVIVLGCTSVSFGNLCSSIKIPKAYRNSRFITAFDSMIFQIKKIKAKNILLFAPYDKSTIDAEADMLEACGLNVVKCIPLTYKDEIRYITTEQVYNTFEKEYTSQCDIVLFSCTALYTLEAINNIKTRLNVEIPMLSSNSAISDTLNDLYHEHLCQPGEA